MRVCASGEEDEWLRLCRILTALTIAAQLQRINRCVALPLLSIYLRDRGDFNVICFCFVELFFFCLLTEGKCMIPPCLISSLPLVLLFFLFSSVAFVVNAYKAEKSFLFFFTWTACTEFACILFTRTQRKEKRKRAHVLRSVIERSDLTRRLAVERVARRQFVS